ncbi:AraC family transcriptional regulator [Pedobacter sp. ASV12]|uniref:AraC family transcriptional regulator n=1 Tax=Pedobacter sp. ASV12 TaxID=2795120 RepID=UPI0018EA6620|nr:AraC family transcriptional regulator [Pedobacter sp. ASV12]
MKKHQSLVRIKKREGFEGQRHIVLPKKVESTFLKKDPITKQIYITDIGYFPKAKNHFVVREEGAEQHILIYCVDGTGWIEVEGQPVAISPSTFFIIPLGTKHSYGADEQNPWSIYWVHFKGKLSGQIIELISEQVSGLEPKIIFNENRIRIFEEIYLTLENGYSDDNLRFITMAFYHFLSSILYEDKFGRVELKNSNQVVSEVIKFMQHNLGASIALKDFADRANLSVSHFSLVFRSATGYSPTDYFNHLKIQKACQQLQFTDFSIKQISNTVGFKDPYYFSRLFSKWMHVSPSAYRKMKK